MFRSWFYSEMQPDALEIPAPVIQDKECPICLENTKDYSLTTLGCCSGKICRDCIPKLATNNCPQCRAEIPVNPNVDSEDFPIVRSLLEDVESLSADIESLEDDVRAQHERINTLEYEKKDLLWLDNMRRTNIDDLETTLKERTKKMYEYLRQLKAAQAECNALKAMQVPKIKLRPKLKSIVKQEN